MGQETPGGRPADCRPFAGGHASDVSSGTRLRGRARMRDRDTLLDLLFEGRRSEDPTRVRSLRRTRAAVVSVIAT